MPTRRQEKVAQVVKRAVSEAITHDLADPRIVGIVSVTRVEVAADLRNADVYMSIYAETSVAENLTFDAIQNARRHIQSRVADAVQSKFCPVLHLHRDEKFKKTLELMNLIDQAAEEYRDKDAEAVSENANGSPAVVEDNEREIP